MLVVLISESITEEDGCASLLKYPRPVALSLSSYSLCIILSFFPPALAPPHTWPSGLALIADPLRAEVSPASWRVVGSWMVCSRGLSGLGVTSISTADRCSHFLLGFTSSSLFLALPYTYLHLPFYSPSPHLWAASGLIGSISKSNYVLQNPMLWGNRIILILS